MYPTKIRRPDWYQYYSPLKGKWVVVKKNHSRGVLVYLYKDTPWTDLGEEDMKFDGEGTVIY